MNFDFEKYGQQLMLSLESGLPKLISAVLVLAIGWWLNNLLVKLMYRAMVKSKTDAGMITFLCSLIRSILKIVIFITAVSQLGMNVGSIIAAVGAVGLTIGLALNSSMSNIASGAQIIFTKPFHVDDYIALDSVEGTVERIEIMFTTLTTFDNKKVVIPNSKVTASIITNYSATETRQLSLHYTIGYAEDLTSIKQLLIDLTDSNTLIRKVPSPLIAVGNHGDNGITIEVKVWCKSEDYWLLYYDMQEKVKLAFDKAGIHSPFNQMDVHMKPND